MGDSPSQTTTSTPTLDPDIKARLLANMSTGDAITGGILPTWRAKNTTGAAGTGPSYPGSGAMAVQTPVGGVTIPGSDEGEWVNADGTTWKPPTSFSAGFTPEQLKAFTMIRQMPETGMMSPQALGRDTFDHLAHFEAPTVTSQDAIAGKVGQVADVTSKNFTDYNFTDYATPYMSQVVDPVKSFYQQEGDRAASAATAKARAAGALRGSNPQIAEALTRGEVSRQAGMALSPLYQDAYKTAAGLITTDANRDLTASQGNQSTQLTRATTQAGFDTTANISNAERALRAGIANQGAAVDSANVRESAAINYGLANKGGYDALRQNAIDMLAVGDKSQALDQSKLDDIIKALNIRNALVTGAVPAGSGSVSTTSGGGSGVGGILGGLGSVASGLGALGVTI